MPNYEFFFDFGGDTFTNSYIDTPVNEILVIISTSGSDRFLNFSNINPFGFGLFGGSIDFQNLSNSSHRNLSFEPPRFGSNLDLYVLDGNMRGNYRVTATSDATSDIPEPSTILGLIVVGAMGSFAARQRN